MRVCRVATAIIIAVLAVVILCTFVHLLDQLISIAPCGGSEAMQVAKQHLVIDYVAIDLLQLVPMP